ncbi:MAG: nucleotidyltransferase domain-containing protein [Prevotellaceae bacterium]|nr:nucleotidyltransferase domain-containing protein [Prevotellaceae bacterium]MDO4931236.1 nucleotidyltransferase domain-containing protein [Prevotellaceae bacterium]
MHGIGISDIEESKLISVLKSYPAVEKAVVYGSRAKGNYKAFSDIDMTLFGDKLTHSDLIHIYSDIDDLLLPYEMDLSLYKSLNNKALIDHINRVGITIYQT